MVSDVTLNPFTNLRTAKLDSNLTRSTKEQPSQVETPAPSTQFPSEQANARTGERPNNKRVTTRESFDIYEDQINALRKISYGEKMEGKLGSMSAMVREAIDIYLAKRASEQ